MDERDEKMREISIELMKLRAMQDLPFSNIITYRKEYKTKYEWLYIWTGKKWDIVIFIAMMLGMPLLVYHIAYSEDNGVLFAPWIYGIMDIAMIGVWLYEAVKMKNLPVKEDNDEEEQRAIVRQKIAELKEIEERLKREELQKQQEEQAISEDQKEPAEDEDQENQKD